MMFRELNMEAWSKVHKGIDWTFGLYLRYVLSPSVYLYKRHATVVHMAVGFLCTMILCCAIWGFANLNFDDTDEQAFATGTKAFWKVAHGPLTPLMLVLCTHLIMMVFAAAQLQELYNSSADSLPFPLTCTIICGKTFMIFRMILSYSSTNLGVAVDYFLWQELILVCMHGSLAVFVGDPSPENCLGIPYAKQLARSFLVILGIDSLKTCAMLVFWSSFKPGIVSSYFNRLPNITSMLAVTILVHASFDALQTGTSAFTMFIGRMFVEFMSGTERMKDQPLDRGERSQSMADQLVGRWLTNYGTMVTFEIKYWRIPVPDGLSESQEFEFATVYQVKLPRAKLRLPVPKGKQAGDFVECLELRMHHGLLGYRSFDASSQDLMKSLVDVWPWQPEAHLSADGLILDFKQVVGSMGSFAPFRWTKVVDHKTHKYRENSGL